MKKIILIIALLIVPAGAVFAVTIPSFTITANPKYKQLSISPQLFPSSFSGAIQNDFALSTSTVSITTASPTASSTVSDVIFNEYGLGTTTQTCLLLFPAGSSVLNLTPAIATSNNVGTTMYVSNGTAQFNVTFSQRTRRTSCPISQSVSTSQTFYSFVATSLAYDIYGAATTTIAASSPSNVAIYSSINDTTHAYTRNTALFSGATDLTPIVAYHTGGATTCSGVLVAPDTVITAAHCAPSVGATEWFVNNNNMSTSTTVGARTEVGTTDIEVLHLSSVISSTTTGISFADVFPSNILQNVSPSYITNNANLSGYLPLYYTDQFRELHIASWWEWAPDQIGIAQPTQSNPFYPWYRQVISGDSGSAIGAIYNGSFVALCTFYSAGQCPSIAYYSSQIDAIMTAQDSPYQLTSVNLAGFPTY